MAHDNNNNNNNNPDFNLAQFWSSAPNIFHRDTSSPTPIHQESIMSGGLPGSEGSGLREQSSLFVTPAPDPNVRQTLNLGSSMLRKRACDEPETLSKRARQDSMPTPNSASQTVGRSQSGSGFPPPGLPLRAPSSDRAISVERKPVLIDLSDEIIDLDEEEDLYELRNMRRWVTVHEVKAFIRQELAKTIRESLNFLPPGAKKRQRLQEIALAIKSSKKKFILKSWKEEWKAKLAEVKKIVQAEVDEAESIQEKIKRPESKGKLQEWIDLLQEKVDRLEELEEIRKNIMTDFLELADAD